MKNIFCIGLGKLGLIFSQILAENKYFIYGHDVSLSIKKNILLNKIDLEPKLNYLIKKNRSRFIFEDDYKIAISRTEAAFIILPTPSKTNNEFDNRYILSCINKIGKFLKNKKKYLINITSTVNPGSCNNFIKILEKKFKLKHGREFILTYNPHLIALGSIYNDVINSDLVIVGSDLQEGHSLLKQIYKKIYKKNITKLKFLNLKEAEIAKIAINSYVTMKISFSNTISQIADSERNIDTSKILNTIGFDKRIGHKYLSLGAMFAGPCFPRDNLNFSKYLKNKKLLSILPETIDQINNQQLRRYLKIFKIENKNLTKKLNIGICGITYKDKSSVTTGSPGELLKNYFFKKYNIFIYDQYVDQWKNQKNCKRIENLTTFYKKSDVIFICYRDKNFKKMEKFKSSKKKIIIDLWDHLNVKGKNICYKRIGVS